MKLGQNNHPFASRVYPRQRMDSLVVLESAVDFRHGALGDLSGSGGADVVFPDFLSAQ